MQRIFLVGPTASGKTAVAMELAKLVNAEIVSADSMQVYRGMDIGTAKPTPEQQKDVPHHLIDILEVNQSFDVKTYVELATRAMEEISQREKVALVVGGSGLYVRALRRGLFEGPGRNAALRERLEKLTVAELFAELERHDTTTAERIDRYNRRRLVRALEVYHAGGHGISTLQSQWKEQGSSSSADLIFGMERDREELRERIGKRIDDQIADGWVEEVRRLRAQGFEQNAVALQAAGYRELISHLRGELPLAEAMQLIKVRTRQLAKRQMTWFRREPSLSWLRVERDEESRRTALRVMQEIEKRDQSAD